MGITQGTYIDMMLKTFSMENSKRRLILMSRGVSLSEKVSPAKTSEEREHMRRILDASALGFIHVRNVMYST